MQEEYARLRALGHFVIPTIEQKPSPVVGKWGYYKDKAPPEFPLRGSDGLAIICNKTTGVMCIDVDIIDTIASKALIDYILSIAPTKYTKFGSKGLTLFYKWGDFKHERLAGKGEQKPEDTCVDIITNGLTVMPPSLHHKTKQNYTVPEGFLPICAAGDLPELSSANYLKIVYKIKSQINDEKPMRKQATNKDTRFFYIQQKAMDLCRHGEGDLITQLIEWDIAQKFSKGPYFSDPKHQTAEAVINGCQNKIYAEIFKNKDALEALRKKRVKPMLPEPRGYIRKIYECLKVTASAAKDHNFRYLSSLFIFSTLINKKIKIRHGTSHSINSAMFCFILGDTGSGKSSVINQIKKFIDNYPKPLAGVPEVVHKGIGVSLARVYDDIEEKSTTVFVEEEAKSLLEKLTRQHSHGSLESFDSYFTTLWDQKKYIDNPSRSINSKKMEVKDKKENCMVSLFVGTTKKSFLESVTSDIIENGLLNRCVVLDVETDTELNDFDGEQFTEEEIDRLYYRINSDINDRLPFAKNINITKESSPEVMKFYSQKELEGRIAVSKGDSYQARKAVLICKIALLLKASDDISFNHIEIDYYLRAEEIYNIMQESFSVLLSDLKSGSKQEIAKRQIVRLVMEHDEGISVPKIQGIKIPHGSTKAMLIKQLETEGLLIVENKKNDSLMSVRANFLAILNSNYF